MRKLAVCVTFMNEKYRHQIDEAANAAGFVAHYYDTQAALTPHIGDYEVCSVTQCRLCCGRPLS